MLLWGWAGGLQELKIHPPKMTQTKAPVTVEKRGPSEKVLESWHHDSSSFIFAFTANSPVGAVVHPVRHTDLTLSVSSLVQTCWCLWCPFGCPWLVLNLSGVYFS